MKTMRMRHLLIAAPLVKLGVVNVEELELFTGDPEGGVGKQLGTGSLQVRPLEHPGEEMPSRGGDEDHQVGGDFRGEAKSLWGKALTRLNSRVVVGRLRYQLPLDGEEAFQVSESLFLLEVLAKLCLSPPKFGTRI